MEAKRKDSQPNKAGKAARWFLPAAIGAVCGLLNGLFGAGGGIAAVPLLKKSGLPLKKAHATSLAVILPLSLVSAGLYLSNGSVQLPQALPYLPGGFAGACLGAALLQKIPGVWLRRAFGAFMVYAAVRLLLK